ncbi:MAG: phosphatidate cytidylyltransferase [Bacteroidales bacterium]|nr:phosphatidate cytidylyltransferase [Bacteroidales bacterium]
MKKNLIIRSLSAVVFLLVLLSGIILNEYLYISVFTLITIIAQAELYIIFKKQGYNPQMLYGLFVGLVIFILTFLVAKELIPPTSYFIAIFLILFLFIFELYHYRENHFVSIAFTIFGIVYVVIPMSTLNFIAFAGINQNIYTYEYLLAMFIMIWVNDSGAYLIGSIIGKHKLFERISPKKTWEGTIGGLLSTIAATYVVSIFFTGINLFQWLIFAVIVVIFGTYGDLVESQLKRRAGVKDSGNIMPGHGGLLDRFDSTFFAAPMIFLYLKAIEYFF